MMDMRLEVMVLPVTDVDRAKDFYKELGWRLDADFTSGPDFRVVQLTPPGSPCSVIFGTGITAAVPGSSGAPLLVVTGIQAARDEIAGRGAGISEVFHDEGGVFHHAARAGSRPGSGRPQLRLVRLVQRPGRQRLAVAGDHHPPAGPLSSDFHGSGLRRHRARRRLTR